jgi:hypothetical protein
MLVFQQATFLPQQQQQQQRRQNRKPTAGHACDCATKL